jgi:endonuclease III
MAVTTRRAVVEAALERYPKTFAEEVGVRRLDTPAPLFRLLVLALLMSARIRASIARDAAAALFRAGWRTPARMAEASWDSRARTLNRAGYARYDERTSTMLADTSRLLLDRYGGDLRRLRDEAGRHPRRERALLEEFKGIGDVGVDIFFRDVQAAWGELFPFVDRRALAAADRLGLGTSAEELARHVSKARFVHLVNALVRIDGAHDDVLAAAR